MNRLKTFPMQVLAVLVTIGVCAAYPLSVYASREVILAVGAGALLSTVNVLLGYAAIEYAFDKSYTTFLKVVLGGMGLRLLVMLAAMLVLVLIGHLHVLAFTISMLGLYAVFLGIEIGYIQKKVLAKNQR